MTIKIISWEFCSRCHMIAPLLKKYAEDNGYSFLETMLPAIYFWDERVEYDDALAKVMG